MGEVVDRTTSLLIPGKLGAGLQNAEARCLGTYVTMGQETLLCLAGFTGEVALAEP